MNKRRKTHTRGSLPGTLISSNRAALDASQWAWQEPGASGGLCSENRSSSSLGLRRELEKPFATIGFDDGDEFQQCVFVCVWCVPLVRDGVYLRVQLSACCARPIGRCRARRLSIFQPTSTTSRVAWLWFTGEKCAPFYMCVFVCVCDRYSFKRSGEWQQQKLPGSLLRAI